MTSKSDGLLPYILPDWYLGLGKAVNCIPSAYQKNGIFLKFTALLLKSVAYDVYNLENRH